MSPAICQLRKGQTSGALFCATLAGLLLFSVTLPAADPFTISVVAGTGIQGFSGDGGPATNAQLNFPTGVVLGPDQCLYICDTSNHRVRKVNREGLISTVAGTGEPGWSGDHGPASAAKLNEPYEARFDREGNLFWVERVSATVRRMDHKTGVITTIAGSGTAGFSGDNGPATQAKLAEPHSIGFDKQGDLYICDVRNHRLRKVTMSTGVITTVSGTGEKRTAEDNVPFKDAPLSGPRALDFDARGNLILALREGNAVLRLDFTSGRLHLLAGSGKSGFSGDGAPARNAMVAGPKGVTVDVHGNIYFADTESQRIRLLEASSGKIMTVAGTGKRGDGTAADALRCDLDRPHGIFSAADGAIYIGDSGANRVRVLR
jgi:streptogramin lyase